MSEEQLKKAVDFAQKEIQKEKEEQLTKLVKKIVQETLENVERLDEEIKERQEKKKVLKQTLDDLKSGKLDLIKEKMEKDPKAAEVIREVVKIQIVQVPVYIEKPEPYNPWKYPWQISYIGGYVPATLTGGNLDSEKFYCSSSQVKNATFGTYCLSNGHSVDLR